MPVIGLQCARIAGRNRIERIPLLLIGGSQTRQLVVQIQFAGQRDVVLLDLQVVEIGTPVVLILLPRLVESAGEGELIRRIDPLDRFVEPLHGDDADVILAENCVHAVSQAQ